MKRSLFGAIGALTSGMVLSPHTAVLVASAVGNRQLMHQPADGRTSGPLPRHGNAVDFQPAESKMGLSEAGAAVTDDAQGGFAT